MKLLTYCLIYVLYALVDALRASYHYCCVGGFRGVASWESLSFFPVRGVKVSGNLRLLTSTKVNNFSPSGS